MIVYFTIVKRKRPVREAGELVKLNWANKKVISSVPLFPENPDIDNDPNPRGNSRGGKGILLKNDELFVGTYHTIMVYDLDLNLKRTLTNDLFVNLHEMCFDGNDIWVSSTTIDLALKVDLYGKTLDIWQPRNETELQKLFNVSPLNIDLNIDNRLIHLHSELGTKKGHTHLNTIANFDGNIFTLLNKQGVIFQIEPEKKIIFQSDLIRGSHSLNFWENKNYGILCGTRSAELIIIDFKKKKINKHINLLKFQEIKKLKEESPDEPFNKSIFVRGLEIIGKDRVLVGISPASIVEIDIRKPELIDIFRFSDEVGDAVHGIAK